MVYTTSNRVVVESFSQCYTGSGFTKSKKVDLYELCFSGSPEACAIAISKKETELYQSLKLKGKIYTLFMGPMEYVEGTLRIRLGIATGIHRL